MNKGRRRITFVFFWARFDCALRNGFCSEQSPAHAAVAVDCRCYRFVVPFRFIPFSLTRLRHSKLSMRERSGVCERERARWSASNFESFESSQCPSGCWSGLFGACVCVQAALSRSLFEWESRSQLSATAAWADRQDHAQQQQIGAAHAQTHAHVLSSHSHALPLCCALYLSLSLKPLF